MTIYIYCLNYWSLKGAAVSFLAQTHKIFTTRFSASIILVSQQKIEDGWEVQAEWGLCLCRSCFVVAVLSCIDPQSFNSGRKNTNLNTPLNVSVNSRQQPLLNICSQPLSITQQRLQSIAILGILFHQDNRKVLWCLRHYECDMSWSMNKTAGRF